jgi:aspartyl-tRNA(Asn)/glutamyl-tRNA(Gln) amidotransferase subunit B
MEKGSLRCDANISVDPRTVGAYGHTPLLGTKVEIKNMNSFRSVRSALLFEIKRQSDELEQGNRIPQETRLWDQGTQVTRSMRSKEEAHDYRYFPEPDLVPVIITNEVIEGIRKNLPELAVQRQQRFSEQYELPEYDAAVLTRDKWTADYFETCVRLHPKPKIVANWIMGDLMARANERGVDINELGCKPEWLVQLLELVDRQTISGKMAKELLVEIIQKKQPPLEIVAGKGLAQISDERSLLGVIEEVIGKNQKSVEDYHGGKATALMFLVGQVMKGTSGKANPQKVQELLRKKLKEGGV